MEISQEPVIEELEGAKNYERMAEEAEKQGDVKAAETYRRHAEEEEQHALENAEIIREHKGQRISKPFNDLEYTRRELAGELYEIQKHASNGSALQNCKCIQEKHLLGVRTEAAEGVTIASDPKEKEFYAWLSPWADSTLDHVLDTLDANNDAQERAMWGTLADDTREIRHSITDGTFHVPNPASTRAYLPHGLTTEEKESKSLQNLLSRCIRKAEIRCCGGHTTDYSLCECNPVAVCRSSVEK